MKRAAKSFKFKIVRIYIIDCRDVVTRVAFIDGVSRGRGFFWSRDCAMFSRSIIVRLVTRAGARRCPGTREEKKR